jgi:hypothetical protein
LKRADFTGYIHSMYGLAPVTTSLFRLNRRITTSPNVSSATARLYRSFLSAVGLQSP